MKLIKIILILFIFLNHSIEGECKDIEYPLNEVDRPLTIPKGFFETGIKLRYRHYSSSVYAWDLDSVPSYFRYGINDNLEISYLEKLFYDKGGEIWYRAFDQNDIVELVIKGGLSVANYSSDTYTMLEFNLGFDAKQRISKKIALLYGLNIFPHIWPSYDSETRNYKRVESATMEMKFGAITCLTEKSAIELIYNKRVYIYSKDNINWDMNADYIAKSYLN